MIRNVGGLAIQPQHRLSCHCGSVVLELDLPEGIVNPRRCDCSICRRKGAIVASDVSLEVQLTPRVERAEILHRYPCKPGERSLRVRIGGVTPDGPRRPTMPVSPETSRTKQPGG